ncbi:MULTISPECIES: excalibur calcium-binding domain-containing protein [Bacillus]|uniref:excalibur calcium-binding domain-containing protein n=1 Tax=Bacillus TaxID=1386 RepID=UPI0035B535AB
MNVEAKTPAAAKTYKNCTELNKDYKGGVARSSSDKNKGGKTKYKPYVSKALYNANKTKDRDGDNIACEK